MSEGTGTSGDQRSSRDDKRVVAPSSRAEPAEDGAAPTAPRRGRHRRAFGGTTPRAAEPGEGTRSPDDLDVGWGEQAPGSDDERLLREVPPHW